MRTRIKEELALLRQQYGEVEHIEVAGVDWFRLPRYPLPDGWQIGSEPVEEVPIAFPVPSAYPGSPPYGFLTPAGLNFKGATPGNPGSSNPPPFEGNWMHFSWTVENWTATSDLRKGSNLLTWCRSFGERLREGA